MGQVLIMDFTKIKLVIWDLDETFWNGILSEHTVSIIPENIELIKNMTDAGVVNSICSKNDEREVSIILDSLGLKGLFVFTSINWSPKGSRVSQIIQEMNLRSVNVLFLDDNPTNLAEVSSACEGIMTANTDALPALRDYYRSVPKKDLLHSRLDQYHILEKKREFQATAGSNEEFLRKCDIHVKFSNDCITHLARIEELVQRSNQLNFTKVRSSEEELAELFVDPSVKCGYVIVEDNFGAYGIVGFYAIKENRLLHFVFSCRIMNMGIEQYTYHKLGQPKLQIVGTVSSSPFESCPDWINQNKTHSGVIQRKVLKEKVIIKGPCDMQILFSFIKETKNIETEFVYINNHGISIEQGNHTTHIVESITLANEVKNRIIQDLPFGDKGMFQTAIFDHSVKWILFSLLTDPNLGLYRDNKSGAYVAFGEYTNDLTDTRIWSKLIQKDLFTANCSFTEESLGKIKQNYSYCGRIEPEQVLHNLKFIRDHISPSANLILCLGSELPFEGNTQVAYQDRHIYHQKLNQLVREWAAATERVYLLDTNQYINSQEDYTNNINHFTKAVYYQMAHDFVSLVNGSGHDTLGLASDLDMRRSEIYRKLKSIPKKLLRIIHGK